MKPYLRLLVSLMALPIVFAATFFLVFIVRINIYNFAESVIDRLDAVPGFSSVTGIGIPVLAVILFGRWLMRKEWLKRPPGINQKCIRAGKALLIAGYLLTVVFGIPAVQTHEDNWVVEQYKKTKEAQDRKEPGAANRVWGVHPMFQTTAAVPLLPGLIITDQSYTIHGLWGFGGYRLFIWYGGGVKRIAEWALWIS